VTTPPSDSGTHPGQTVLEAIAAALLVLSSWLMRRSGKEPRPTRVATYADIQRVTLALEALQSSTDAVARNVDRSNELIAQHGRRLTRLEVAVLDSDSPAHI